MLKSQPRTALIWFFGLLCALLVLPTHSQTTTGNPVSKGIATDLCFYAFDRNGVALGLRCIGTRDNPPATPIAANVGSHGPTN